MINRAIRICFPWRPHLLIWENLLPSRAISSASTASPALSHSNRNRSCSPSRGVPYTRVAGIRFLGVRRLLVQVVPEPSVANDELRGLLCFNGPSNERAVIDGMTNSFSYQG